MAVTEPIELLSVGGGSTDNDGYSTYQRVYRVICDDRNDGHVIIKAAIQSQLSLQIGSAYVFEYETNPDATLKNIKSDPVSKLMDGRFLWNATLEFDDKPIFTNLANVGGFTPSGEPQNKKATPPELRAWQIDRGDVQIERAMVKDFSSTPKPIINAARLPIPYTYPVPIGTITVTFNSLTTTETEQEDYIGAINDEPYYIWAAGQVLCKGYSVRNVLEKVDGTNLYYYEKTVTLWIANKWLNAKNFTGGSDEISWDVFLANAGTMALVNGKYVRCIDSRGAEAAEPMPLRANGTQIPPAPLVGPPEEIEYLRFRMNPWTDFTYLLT